jgi:hypothetical protein
MRIAATTEPAASPTVPAATETRSLRLDVGPSVNRPTPVDTSYERREGLERELDRVQGALLGERNGFAQQLNWLMLSQALLLNAFLFVLILGWSTPLPGKRLLLVGLAVFAVAVAVLIVLALRGTRDAVMSLHHHRKSLEATLQKDFGRAPLFTPPGLVTRGLATFAHGALPATLVAGWVALALYTLAAPLGTNAEPAAASTSAPAQAQRGDRVAQPRQLINGTAQADVETQAVSGEARPTPRRTGGFKW